MSKYAVTSGIQTAPVKTVLYGPEGIGKSTFASHFPSPVFIDTEGGTKRLNVARLPQPTSWAMLLDEVAEVRKGNVPCSTLVIDTADWAERLCIQAVCARAKVNGIEDFGYGKGYTYVKEEFSKLLDALEEVLNAGHNVVVLAHAAITKFEQPDAVGNYDRWGMKTSKQVAPLLQEWCDMLLFANYKTVVEKAGSGPNAKNKASGGKRVLYTTHHACWDAKNRFDLPEEVPFDYASIAHCLPGGSAPAATQTPVQHAPAPAPQPKHQPDADILPTPQAQPEPPREEVPKALLTPDLVALGVCTRQDLAEIAPLARKINEALIEIFAKIDVKLVDFKIEMGRATDGTLLLADEITPDSCRLWDQKDHSGKVEHLDKDLFRRGLGSIIPAYEEIEERLAELAKSEGIEVTE